MISPQYVTDTVSRALLEDVGTGDLTASLIASTALASATIMTREPGILCGMAGAYLSTAHGSGFVREMTAGKGYIALAAMIFGKWQPRGALLACLLFGFLEAVASRLQGVELPLIGQAPVDLILALPYLLTVILLAGFVGKAMPPRAIGEPYIKER